MNREILFRGRSIRNVRWVEGGYCKKDETTYCTEEDYRRNPVPTHHYIVYEHMTDWGLPNELSLVEVDPSTICQYTGLADKNGKKIFEGDILKTTIPDDFELCEFNSIVLWNEDRSGFYAKEQGSIDLFALGECDLENSVVIGNIFNNSDMVKG